MDVEFRTYADKWHPDITEFRDQVCMEYGAEDSSECMTHKQAMEKYAGNEGAEEIYKFSQTKWGNTDFDSIEAIAYEGKVVSISGCKSHGDSLRILMNRYSLKPIRTTINRYTWHAGGVIDRHLADAVARNKSAIFFSIYEHNVTLKTFADYLRKKKSNHRKPLLGKFDELNTNVLFNGVPQSIFYYLIDEGYSFTEEVLLANARN